jgi:hypothetical protein
VFVIVHVILFRYFFLSCNFSKFHLTYSLFCMRSLSSLAFPSHCRPTYDSLAYFFLSFVGPTYDSFTNYQLVLEPFRKPVKQGRMNSSYVAKQRTVPCS